jgi:type VI secretion system secreted protein VgrG
MSPNGRANEPEFLFKICKPEKELGVLAFTATERMSSPFEVRLTLVSEDEITFDKVMNKEALLTIVSEDKAGKPNERYFHGIISEFTQAGRSGRFHMYRARVVPALWRLSLERDCRIFQEKKIPGIVEDILKDGEIKTDRYSIPKKVKDDCQSKTYCVQYRETDLNFISRLLEEEGIFYFFEHAEDKHVLIFGNDPVSYKPIEGKKEVVFNDDRGMVPNEDFVSDITLSCQVHTGKVTLRDFNYETCKVDLRAEQKADEYDKLEVYDYPGEYAEQDPGKKLAQIRLQEATMFKEKAEGKSNCSRFAPGFTFTLEEHGLDALNKEHLLVEVTHRGSQPQVLEERAGTGVNEYSNTFLCIESSVPFRPVRATPKPVVEGVQTAIVVGPKGEEIYTDDDGFGRVKVHFHWDRKGEKNEESSCWIRVGQLWAGVEWGAMFIPRIGQEVIVDFIEGDPDRPIITGRVYNNTHMPPYTLPEHKTKSTIKSNSSPDGDGFNEIRFEDKKGEEEIFIHGEKNLDLRVKHDRKEWIGNDGHLIVQNNLFEGVEGNKHLTVKSDYNEKVDGTLSIEAGQDMQEKAGGKHALDAGQEIHLKAGMKVIVEAGTQVSLKAGGSFVDVGPAGVTIQGTMVNINSGGSAGSGSGSSPASPEWPQEAGLAEPGERTHLTPFPPSDTPQAQALQQASQAGTPLCEN